MLPALMNAFTDFLQISPLSADTDGKYHVRFDDAHVECFEGKGYIYMAGKVGHALADANEHAEWLVRLAQIALVSLAQYPVTLCINKSCGSPYVFCRYSLRGEDERQFIEHMEYFVNALEFFQEQASGSIR